MSAAVHFLNIRSQAELAATYRYFAARGSVFALTSFYEPFGLAPIEAAAAGLAPVATNNGGPTEIFADGSVVLDGGSGMSLGKDGESCSDVPIDTEIDGWVDGKWLRD